MEHKMVQHAENFEEIQRQFQRQGEAYKRLKYVADDAGLKRVVGMTHAGPEDRIVDFASGPGFLTMKFAEVCKEALGVDATDTFLESAREEAKQRGLSNIRFLKGDVVDTGLDSNYYDIAICRAAFHHFPDPAKALAEMKRVTKPGGQVIVIDMKTSDDQAKADEHNALEILCDPTHVRALTEAEFTQLFETENLEITRQRGGETKYSLEDWIDHGGPSQENADRIRETIEASSTDDRLGLSIWREDDAIHFAHNGVAFVTKKSAE